MSEALKPCPFCGGKVEIYAYDRGDGKEGDLYGIECEHCEVTMSGWYWNKDETIKIWNRRADDEHRETD